VVWGAGRSRGVRSRNDARTLKRVGQAVAGAWGVSRGGGGGEMGGSPGVLEIQREQNNRGTLGNENASAG